MDNIDKDGKLINLVGEITDDRDFFELQMCLYNAFKINAVILPYYDTKRFHWKFFVKHATDQFTRYPICIYTDDATFSYDISFLSILQRGDEAPNHYKRIRLDDKAPLDAISRYSNTCWLAILNRIVEKCKRDNKK